MPERTDIKSILTLGTGPIVTGQVCEFDYSGAQVCKALRKEGYHITLVNSNPVTIMTDPEMADVTYIEPIHWEVVRKITEKEYLDVVLPTVGGQTALGCALEPECQDMLEELGVTMIGTTADTIDKTEDRRRFDVTIKRIGLETARSGIAYSMGEVLAVAAEVGFPCIIRPPFTMGDSGGGIVYNREEFEETCARGLDLSPTKELLIDGSLIGWKEYEMKVVHDKNGSRIIVCSIENFDVMGIHTGDSITAAPAQALADKEYQIICDASMVVLREIGVETGGSNAQFTVNPKNGRLIVIEMNPRMSRSSALASKATGLSIAKVAAKLAVSYTLGELTNDIAGGYTPISFESSIDYVVIKIPHFNFKEFAGANGRLTTQMRSVGEVMATGCTQQESSQKALRGPEVDATGLDPKVSLDDPEALAETRREPKDTGAERTWRIADAFCADLSVDGAFNLVNTDRWFPIRIEELVCLEEKIAETGITSLHVEFPRQLKHKGLADTRPARLAGMREVEIRKLHDQYDLHPVHKHVDICATGFATNTVYMHSTYEEEYKADPSVSREKIMMLDDGPNRVGQDIEFDYCCVHASLALYEDGYETIMVNCNPETVSTDYDILDHPHFEPTALEDVLEIMCIEKPKGVIVQYSGQTPLKLACALEAAGAPVIGTSPDAIDRAGDCERFQHAVECLKLKQLANATVTTTKMAVEKAKETGHPLVVRSPYVLGGWVMGVIYGEADLRHYSQTAVSVSNDALVLLDHFLDDTVEVDADIIYDDEVVLIGDIIEYVEQTGVHSGDSACSLPAYTLGQEIQDVMCQRVQKLVFELQVYSPMNVQFAVKNGEVCLIEVNPRVAHTVPFVSRATDVPLAEVAARAVAGKLLVKQGVTKEIIPPYYLVKEMVLPFDKFPGVDPLLRPKTRPTGGVMGVGRTFAEASTEAQLDNSFTMKKCSRALLSIREGDKERAVDLTVKLLKQGFELDVTHDTAIVLGEVGVSPRLVDKVHEGRPHIQDHTENGGYTYIVNTTSGRRVIEGSCVIHRSALQYKAHYDTTLNGGFATAMALNVDATEKVISVQEVYVQIRQ